METLFQFLDELDDMVFATMLRCQGLIMRDRQAAGSAAEPAGAGRQRDGASGA
jgi:hypothetical protein